MRFFFVQPLFSLFLLLAKKRGLIVCKVEVGNKDFANDQERAEINGKSFLSGYTEHINHVNFTTICRYMHDCMIIQWRFGLVEVQFVSIVIVIGNIGPFSQ